MAMGIFFMCMYSLIVLTMKNLENARQLQFVEPDVGWVASELSLLSEVEEGPVDGSGDFGDHYPEWSWVRGCLLPIAGNIRWDWGGHRDGGVVSSKHRSQRPRRKYAHPQCVDVSRAAGRQ